MSQLPSDRSMPVSENSESSRNSRNTDHPYVEGAAPMEIQQPSLLRGSFTQIMVNPMQLQDHDFTAWLDRLVEARKN